MFRGYFEVILVLVVANAFVTTLVTAIIDGTQLTGATWLTVFVILAVLGAVGKLFFDRRQKEKGTVHLHVPQRGWSYQDQIRGDIEIILLHPTAVRQGVVTLRAFPGTTGTPQTAVFERKIPIDVPHQLSAGAHRIPFTIEAPKEEDLPADNLGPGMKVFGDNPGVLGSLLQQSLATTLADVPLRWNVEVKVNTARGSLSQTAPIALDASSADRT